MGEGEGSLPSHSFLDEVPLDVGGARSLGRAPRQTASVPLGELMNATRRLADRLLALPEKAATRTKHGIDGIFIGPRWY